MSLIANLPRAKAAGADPRLRDSLLMKQLHIVHKAQVGSQHWPKHIRGTFGAIQQLGSIRTGAFNAETSAPGVTPRWKKETQFRAEKIAAIAERLIKENPSEMKWRLELENLVFDRFTSMTECSECDGRLWRSEIEVVTEANGRIAESLGKRRQRRAPCECNIETYQGLNPLFSNRADEFIRYDHQILPAINGMELPKRRPDRVYGLRQTSTFERALSNVARKVQDIMRNGVEDVLESSLPEQEKNFIWNLIQSSPFSGIEDPLLFPFLLVEAKSEKGGSFSSCGVQSAVPIWYLLRVQEKLQEISGLLNEQGGPCMWYIAYRGDNWRVSGCCIMSEKELVTYQIIDLWNGRLSSSDEALQLLHIVDYIFDWARDLYRPGIQRTLESISQCEFDDTASLMADTDIYSRKIGQNLDTMSVVSSDDGAHDLRASDKTQELLSPWVKFDGGVGGFYNHCFRPKYIVKRSFQCLHLTRDNISTFFGYTCQESGDEWDIAQDITRAMRNAPFIITQSALSQMEEEWTGMLRPVYKSAKKLMLTFTLDLSLSSDWEQVQALTCIAVEEDAVEILCRTARWAPGRMQTLIDAAPKADDDAFIKLVQQAKTLYAGDSLNLALQQPRGFFNPKHWPRFKITSNSRDKSATENLVISLVLKIYESHRTPGVLELPYSYLRFSSRLENGKASQDLDMSQQNGNGDRDSSSDEPVFVAKNHSQTGWSACLYVSIEGKKGPTFRELVSALIKAAKTCRFYISHFSDTKWRLAGSEDHERFLKYIETWYKILFKDSCRFHTRIAERYWGEMMGIKLEMPLGLPTTCLWAGKPGDFSKTDIAPGKTTSTRPIIDLSLPAIPIIKSEESSA